MRLGRAPGTRGPRTRLDSPRRTSTWARTWLTPSSRSSASAAVRSYGGNLEPRRRRAAASARHEGRPPAARARPDHRREEGRCLGHGGQRRVGPDGTGRTPARIVAKPRRGVAELDSSVRSCARPTVGRRTPDGERLVRPSRARCPSTRSRRTPSNQIAASPISGSGDRLERGRRYRCRGGPGREKPWIDPPEQDGADQGADEGADDPAPEAVGQPDREVPDGEAHHDPREHRPSATPPVAAVARPRLRTCASAATAPCPRSRRCPAPADVVGPASVGRRRSVAGRRRLPAVRCAVAGAAPATAGSSPGLGRRSDPPRATRDPVTGAELRAPSAPPGRGGIVRPRRCGRGAWSASRCVAAGLGLVDAEVALHLLELGRRHALGLELGQRDRCAARGCGVGSTSPRSPRRRARTRTRTRSARGGGGTGSRAPSSA